MLEVYFSYSCFLWGEGEPFASAKKGSPSPHTPHPFPKRALFWPMR